MTKLRSGKTYYKRPLTREEQRLQRKVEYIQYEYSLKRGRTPKLTREHYRSWNTSCRLNLQNIFRAATLEGRPFWTLNWHEKRVKVELIDFVAFAPPGVGINGREAAEKIMEWNIQLQGPPNSLYAGETFDLSVKFPEDYPFSNPDVRFKPPNIPIHPRVYRDGRIDEPLFKEDWNAFLTVEYICLHLSKMLRMCQQKRRPRSAGKCLS